MSDIDNDSVFDDDDFGNDVATVVKAPKVVMKKFDDIVDQIAPLYYAASNNSYQMDRFKVNCWNLICAKVGISITEGEQAKEEDLWLLCRSRYIETKDNLYLQSNLNFIFNSFREVNGWPQEVLDDLNIRENNLKIRGSWIGHKMDKIKKANEQLKLQYYFMPVLIT